MLTKEFKENWITGLRSGKYIQGKGQLRIRDGKIIKHCCLGVGAEVNNMIISEDGREIIDNKNNSLGYFPLDELITHTEVVRLYSMNDSQKLTFEKIADYIETLPAE